MPLARPPAHRAIAAPAVSRATFRPLLLASLGIAVGLLLALSVARAGGADPELPAPSRERSPEEVVAIVVEALRTNAGSGTDAGIETVYRFASPGNRAGNGPLARFTRMIKRSFADMLEHESSRFDTMRIVDDKALQAVWLTTPSGLEVGYAFQLGRQREGEYEGMWMTESVFRLGEGERSGTRI